MRNRTQIPRRRRKRNLVQLPECFDTAAWRLGLPATWEHMEALGLDPRTGEKVAV